MTTPMRWSAARFCFCVALAASLAHGQARAVGHPIHGKVVVATAQDLASARHSFPQDTPRFWCLALLPRLPSTTALTFTWLGRYGSLFSYPTTAAAYPTRLAYTYLEGPLDPGTYTCQLRVGGKLFGAARFSVH